MIYNATYLIAEALEKAELKYALKEAEGISYTESGISGAACSYMLRFLSGSDREVKAMTSVLAKYPQEKIGVGLALVNGLNRQYRYAKFTLDEADGGVLAQYDFPVSMQEKDIGPVAVEILIRFMQIIDDAYPKLMRSIWA